MRARSYLALLAGLLAAGCDGQERPAQRVNVDITGSGYEPRSAVVEQGGTVIWTNKSREVRQVIARQPAGVFMSGTLDDGEAYQWDVPETQPPGPILYEDYAKPVEYMGTLTIVEKGQQPQ